MVGTFNSLCACHARTKCPHEIWLCPLFLVYKQTLREFIILKMVYSEKTFPLNLKFIYTYDQTVEGPLESFPLRVYHTKLILACS